MVDAKGNLMEQIIDWVRGPRPLGTSLAATPTFDTKMQRNEKIVLSMTFYGYLKDIIFLNSGIFRILNVDKNGHVIARNNYTHIWMYASNFCPISL